MKMLNTYLKLGLILFLIILHNPLLSQEEFIPSNLVVGENLTVFGRIGAIQEISSTGNIVAQGELISNGRVRSVGDIEALENVLVAGELFWAADGLGPSLSADQGASIKLRGSGTPYIDFLNDEDVNFDIRLSLANDNLLNLAGGGLGINTTNLGSDLLAVNGSARISSNIRWGNTGAFLSTNQGASVELRGNGVPYFDFSNDPVTDFDIRMILVNNDLLRIDGGSLGIGTNQVGQHRLAVGGSARVASNIHWGSTGAILSTGQGASIELRGNGTPYIDFTNDPTTDFDMRMILLNNNVLNINGGSVGIGTGITGSHRLAVEGSIGARAVLIESGSWSDFVFAKDYNLPPLDEVEKFIQENGHLRDIPSEAEVIQNGINVAEIEAKLLQKIEELTLYTIQQQKELVASHERITQLEKLVEAFIQKVEGE